MMSEKPEPKNGEIRWRYNSTEDKPRLGIRDQEQTAPKDHAKSRWDFMKFWKKAGVENGMNTRDREEMVN